MRALDGISLEIRRGEFAAIVGHSGSGKSTLMNMLGCLDSPTSGRYYLDGKDVSQLSDNELSDIRNQKIGFIFQGFNLIPNLDAVGNVELPLIYLRTPFLVFLLTKTKESSKICNAEKVIGLKEMDIN